MQMNKEVVMVNLSDIIPNRFQPRLTFDEEALNELTNSIRQHGIIQPLILRDLGSKYEIIAGERRYKAATMAGLKQVPAIVGAMDDQTSAELALIENIQRKDLSAIEEAKSYKKILEMGSFTQDELAKRMGKSQSTVANKMRLLALTNEAQMALMNNLISERHARCLLQVKDADLQKDVLNRIISQRMNVRDTDNYIKDLLGIKEEVLINTPPSDDNLNASIDNLINTQMDNVVETPKIEEWNPFGDSTPVKDSTPVMANIPTEEVVLPPVQDAPTLEDKVIDNPNVYAETESRNFVNIDSLNDSSPIEANVLDNGLVNQSVNEADYGMGVNEMPDVNSINAEENTPVMQDNRTVHDDGMSKIRLATAIRLAKDTVDDIKTAGYNVKMEEVDTGSEYQIVIKIEK